LALAILGVAAALVLTKPKSATSSATVTTQPSNVTLKVGQTATFTAAATGTPTPTVQWRHSQDDGTTWHPLSGATSDNLVVPNVTASQNGNEYDAVFTGAARGATTSAAVLTVNVTAPAAKRPTVATQPANTKVTAGQTATFAAGASGTPAPTIRWRRSDNGGSTWVPLSGATSDTLVVSNATASQNGDEYDAVFANGSGVATTNTAVLTVNGGTSVTTSTSNPPSSGPGPAATLSTYWQDMSDGSYSSAYAVETAQEQANFPSFVSDRIEADPVINVVTIGSPQYVSGGALVHIEFYARDRYPNPGSDTLCRLFNTSANMIDDGGQWYYGGLVSGGSVVSSNNSECNG
jgi:hypothetical protein